MASASNHAHQVERYWSIGLMGPYSEEVQYNRASAIQRLLDNNPDLDPLYRAMWNKHLINLARNETTYNYRVKNIYQHMRKGPIVEWQE